MANGTIDLECGSTTNNVERQKQVAFTITHLRDREPLRGEEGVQRQQARRPQGQDRRLDLGHTNIKWLTEENQKQNLGMNIVAAKDHAEAFLHGRHRAARRRSSWTTSCSTAWSRTPGIRRSGRSATRRTRSSRTASCCAATIRRSRRSSTTRSTSLLQERPDQHDLREVVPEAGAAEGRQPQRAHERAVQEGRSPSRPTRATRPCTSKSPTASPRRERRAALSPAASRRRSRPAGGPGEDGMKYHWNWGVFWQPAADGSGT